eukprot:2660977-Pyramimonas_sp.AAC.1
MDARGPRAAPRRATCMPRIQSAHGPAALNDHPRRGRYSLVLLGLALVRVQVSGHDDVNVDVGDVDVDVDVD